MIVGNAYDVFRNAIAELDDNGILISCDYFMENGNPVEHILRRFVDYLTSVRMSGKVDESIAKDLSALQQQYFPKTPLMQNLRGGYFSNPIGPYYCNLTITQNALAQNLNIISDQPIRFITILDCFVDNDFAMIIRNYRMEYMIQIDLRFRTISHANGLASDIATMNTRQLRLMNVYNGYGGNLVRAMFQSNRNIPKGCQLYINNRKVADHK